MGSCLALTYILWECLRADRPPTPEWRLDTFCSVLRPLEGNTRYAALERGIDYTGPLWRYAAERVADALSRGIRPRRRAAPGIREST